MTDFAILDPSLKSFNGHFLTYDNAVAQAAAAHGLKPKLFSAIDILPQLPVEGTVVPTFRDGLERSFFRGPLTARLLGGTNMALLRRRFFADMRAHLNSDTLGQNPILYMHTTTPAQLPPMADWLAANKKLKPTLVIMLRYAPSPNPYYPKAGQVEAYREALDYFRDRGVAHLVRLTSDSDTLVEEYKLLTDIPVHLLPIPHTAHLQESVAMPKSRQITYLGNARATKGFQYLPHMVQAIRGELASGAWGCEFQANVMFGRDIASVLGVKLLRRQKVTLYENELSVDDYVHLLLRSSLVVIPYQLLYYYAQTSGVLCEALASAKPVVVPRGTWMAHQIRGRGVGELCLPGDRESFADAVKTAMRNIDALTEKAQAFRAEWVSYHSPTHFMNELMKQVG